MPGIHPFPIPEKLGLGLGSTLTKWPRQARFQLCICVLLPCRVTTRSHQRDNPWRSITSRD